VNAHTHLELSWMAGLVPPAPSMDEWIRTLMRVRKEGAPGGAGAERDALQRAAASMRDTGTVLVGDISNTLATPPVLAQVGLGGIIFYELMGFQPKEPETAVRHAWQR